MYKMYVLYIITVPNEDEIVYPLYQVRRRKNILSTRVKLFQDVQVLWMGNIIICH